MRCDQGCGSGSAVAAAVLVVALSVSACAGDSEPVEAGSPSTSSISVPDDRATEHHDGADAATPEREGDDVLDESGHLTVAVEMNDFGYELEPLEIAAGSTVTFDFTNAGVVEHEAMLGDMHQQEEFMADTDHEAHADGGHHGEIHAITLAPGESGSLTMQFDVPGEIVIGCHLPGHWDAGMKSTFSVV